MADAPSSCQHCPSFLTGANVLNMYGRSPGGDVCARYGTMLSKPGASTSSNRKIREEVGSKCASQGAPKPSEPGREHTVMLPIPTLRENIDPIKMNISSCNQCRSFIPEGEVASDLGWSAGLCGAKGKLIMSNRLGREATGCEYRQFGGREATISMMNLFPIYGDEFLTGRVDPATQMRRDRENFVEPGDYVTDKEVTEEDKTGGIKAWRRVNDPDSDKFTYLPVYDAGFFSDEERATIPKTGDDEHPELYADHFGGLYGLAVAWMELDETPVYWGQPGTGKTELFRYAAWIMQLPFRRLSITADSQIEDTFGYKEFAIDPADEREDPTPVTFFVRGALPTAWISAGILVIDEPNVAREPAIWHGIRPLTDNSKQMVLTQNNNERLDRHPDCFMGMAMNPAWDIRNVGAMEVADADTNRLVHTYVPLPPAEIEREIIKERVKLDGYEIEERDLTMVMKIAEDLRGLAEDDGISITWAIRQQIKVARLLRWYSPPVAYRRAAADALAPDQLEIVMDTVNAHVED